VLLFCDPLATYWCRRHRRRYAVKFLQSCDGTVMVDALASYRRGHDSSQAMRAALKGQWRSDWISAHDRKCPNLAQIAGRRRSPADVIAKARGGPSCPRVVSRQNGNQLAQLQQGGLLAADVAQRDDGLPLRI
jgi:hypothetical protein